MPITVEKTMRKAEKSSAAQVVGKKPIPTWFKIGVGIVLAYFAYSYFTENKDSGNELSSTNSV